LANIRACEHFSEYLLQKFYDSFKFRKVNGVIFYSAFHGAFLYFLYLLLGRLGEQLYSRAEGSFPYCLFPYQKVIGTRSNRGGNSRGENTEMSPLNIWTRIIWEKGRVVLGALRKDIDENQNQNLIVSFFRQKVLPLNKNSASGVISSETDI
jgi:hypothetical protein